MAETLACVFGPKGDPKHDQFLSFLRDHGILATSVSLAAGAAAGYAAYEYGGFGLAGCAIIGAGGALVGLLGASLAYVERPDFVRYHPWIAGISYVAVAAPFTVFLTSETAGLINVPTAMMIGSVAGLSVVAMECAVYDWFMGWWSPKKKLLDKIEDDAHAVGTGVGVFVSGDAEDIALATKSALFTGELDSIKTKQDVAWWIKNSTSSSVRKAAQKVYDLWDGYINQPPNGRNQDIDAKFRAAIGALRYAIQHPSTDDPDADSRFTYVDPSDPPIVQEDEKAQNRYTEEGKKKAEEDYKKSTEGVTYDAEEEFEGDKGNGITAPTPDDLAETERIKQEMLDRAKQGPGGAGWSSNGGPGFRRY